MDKVWDSFEFGSDEIGSQIRWTLSIAKKGKPELTYLWGILLNMENSLEQLIRQVLRPVIAFKAPSSYEKQS